MRVEPIDSYNFSSSDLLFFDTNIWMYLFGPQDQNNADIQIYSAAFAKILSAGCTVFINSLVVSEFINRYARIIQDTFYKNQYRKYKNFRNSNNFLSVAQDIAADAKQVVKLCVPISDGFNSLSIDSLLDEFASGKFDFNDQMITQHCKHHGLKLVTNDKDFVNQDITIITANRSYFTEV